MDLIYKVVDVFIRHLDVARTILQLLEDQITLAVVANTPNINAVQIISHLLRGLSTKVVRAIHTSLVAVPMVLLKQLVQIRKGVVVNILNTDVVVIKIHQLQMNLKIVVARHLNTDVV